MFAEVAKKFLVKPLVLAGFFLFSFFALTASATTVYAPSFPFSLGEFIYEDDYTASTADCNISVWDPSGSLVVNNVLMTEDANGWHYYNFAGSATLGTWPATMSCGTAGVDLIVGDKTFVIATSTGSTAEVADAVATLVNANTNSKIETASSSLVLTIPTAVWGYSGRSLENIANISSGVWNVASSTLFTVGSMGEHLVSNLNGAISNIAYSVWNYTTRLLTGKHLTTDNTELATETYIDTATSTLNTNINTTIQTASSSLAALIDTRASLSSQQAGWTVTMSDFGETPTGEAYQVRLWVLNYESVATDAAELPVITITDAAGSEKLAADTVMIRDSAGVYHYNYTVPADGVGGVWETQISTEVEASKIISTNDYWRLSSSPADVRILSVTDRSVPSITASVELMNQGSSGSDFYYVYCIVDSEENLCGGDDDTDYKSMTEYITAGQTLSRSLSLDVPAAGTYWFKLKARALNEVNWAASAEQFVAEIEVAPSCGDASCNGSETCSSCATDCGQCNNGGGGGGGGGGGAPPPAENENRSPADFGNDGRVDSVDFSILLYFWRTEPPFANPYVDINGDAKVDSVDFSILLYHWGE